MKNVISSSNLDSYTKWEPLIDASTFVAVGALTDLPLSAANATASILINRLQLRSSFQKACALITAIALSTLAFPYLIGSLSLTVALQMSATHLATKVTAFVLFKSGLFLKDYFFLPFPTTLHEVKSVDPAQLNSIKKHLLNFPGKINSLSLSFQATLNKKFEEHGLDPFQIAQFADLGKAWPRDVLKWLHTQDLKHLPLEKRAAIAQLFFDHNLPPQERLYTKEELPDTSLNPKKKELSTPQLQWFCLKFPHSEPPKTSAPRVEIPWKKVTTIGLVAMSAVATVAYFYRQPQEVVIPPLSTALVAIRPMCPSNITESLDNLFLPIVEKEIAPIPSTYFLASILAIGAAAFCYYKPRPAQSPTTDRQLAIIPPRTERQSLVFDMSAPQATDRLNAFLQKLPPLNAPLEIILQKNDGPETLRIVPQRATQLLEDNAPQPPSILEEPAQTINWGKFQDYVNVHCPGIDFEKEAKPLAQEGIEIYQKLYRNEHVEPTNLEDKLRAVCFGLMAHAANKEQPFVEGTFDIKDPGHRLFHFFFPALYGRSSSHYQSRAIPFEDGIWKDYAHFGCDLEKLPAGKRTVVMGRIETRDQSQRIYLKMENWGANLNFYSDSNARANFLQVLNHTLEFFQSQGNKISSWIPPVGEGHNTRKEHLPEDDIRKINAFRNKIESPGNSPDIEAYGLQDAIPFLQKALDSDINLELKKQIKAYLEEIKGRYDNLSSRKGNEVNIEDSLAGIKV